MENLKDWSQRQTGKDQYCVIQSFAGPSLIQERLREMGLSVGTKLRLRGRVVLRGPWLVEYSDTVLALRDEEAVCLNITPV